MRRIKRLIAFSSSLVLAVLSSCSPADSGGASNDISGANQEPSLQVSPTNSEGLRASKSASGPTGSTKEQIRERQERALAKRAEEELQGVIDMISSWDYNNRPGEIRLEDIDEAQKYFDQGLLPRAGSAGARDWSAIISNARQALVTYEANQKTKNSNALREAAAEAIVKTANRLHAAIEEGDRFAIQRLADWEEVLLCAQGQSKKVRTYNKGLPASTVRRLQSPLTHEFEFELKRSNSGNVESAYVVNFGELRSLENMRRYGLQEILDFYSHGASVLGEHKPDANALKMKIVNEESDLPADVNGMPGSIFPDQGSDYYYGWVLYSIPRGRGKYAPSGELNAYIGGKWGEPAKVLFLFADIDGEMAGVKRDNLAYVNDPNYIVTNPTALKYVEESDLNGSAGGVSLIPEPDSGKLQANAVSKAIRDSEAKIVSARLRTALTEGGNGYSVRKYVQDLKSASDSDKLAMIAGMYNEILSAMNKSENAAINARAKLAVLLADGLEGWRYMENNSWLDFFNGLKRAVMPLKHDLQMLRQCYEAIKAARAEGK